MPAFAEKFKSYLIQSNPQLQSVDWTVPSTLVSPHVLEVPASALQEAKDLIRAFHHLRELPAYQDHVSAATGAMGAFNPSNYSLFMSYDFHLTLDGRLKLIEINTNAAGFFVEEKLHSLAGLKNETSLEILRGDFQEETRLSLKKEKPDFTVILDEHPDRQFAYTDFLLARAAIQSWGWACDIVSSEQLLEKQDGSLETPDGRSPEFVYNRLTDFLLERNAGLRRAYLEKKIALSPNPHEYLMLADKGRLIDASEAGWLESLRISAEDIATIRRLIPQTIPLTKQNAAEVFTNRKKMFFKPARSFGSKAGYRGDKVSNQMFDKIVEEGGFLAQEFVPPGEIEVLVEETGKKEKFKFDLRFYAYKGEVRGIGARLFQGQLLNMRAPGSGFCAVALS